MFEISNDQEFSEYLRACSEYAKVKANPVKTNQGPKIAVYSVTPNCYDLLEASMKSLLVNSSVDKIYILIDEEKFPFYLPKEVETINVHDFNFLSPISPNLQTKFTKMCLMRLAFSKVLPIDVDKILSLDYDTIIDKNIDDLWNIDLGEKYVLAGAAERDRTIGYYRGYFNGDDFIKTTRLVTKKDFYINAGVMIMDLKKIREEKLDDAFIDECNREHYRFPEQDIMNLICLGRIYEIEECYNVSRFTYSPSEQKILHFAGDDKNLEHPIIKKYKEIPFEVIEEHRKMIYGK